MAATASPELKIVRALRTAEIAMTLFLSRNSVTTNSGITTNPAFKLDVASLAPICAVLARSAREVNLKDIVCDPSRGTVIIEGFTSSIQRSYSPGIGFDLHVPVAITMGLLAVEVACDMRRADDATLTGFIKDSFRDLGLIVTPLAAAASGGAGGAAAPSGGAGGAAAAPSGGAGGAAAAPIPPLPCAECGLPAFYRCKKCAEKGIDTPYCSAKCQRAQWPVHKSAHPAVAERRARRTRKGNRRNHRGTRKRSA